MLRLVFTLEAVEFIMVWGVVFMVVERCNVVGGRDAVCFVGGG